MSTKHTWHYKQAGRIAVLVDDTTGRVVAEVRESMDGTWHYGSERYLSEAHAKRAAEGTCYGILSAIANVGTDATA